MTEEYIHKITLQFNFSTFSRNPQGRERHNLNLMLFQQSALHLLPKVSLQNLIRSKFRELLVSQNQFSK